MTGSEAWRKGVGKWSEGGRVLHSMSREPQQALPDRVCSCWQASVPGSCSSQGVQRQN